MQNFNELWKKINNNSPSYLTLWKTHHPISEGVLITRFITVGNVNVNITKRQIHFSVHVKVSGERTFCGDKLMKGGRPNGETIRGRDYREERHFFDDNVSN